MIPGGGIRPIATFAIRFFLVALILVPLWWLVVPTYGWLLVQGCGLVLRTVLGVPITAGRIETAGIMNTESLLIFFVNDHETRMKFVQLVTNLPPFVALILASPKLSLKRRFWSTLLGSTLLCGTHALFILVALRFSSTLQQSPEIPTAFAQFFLTLPFLLWMVLAYGRQSPVKHATETGDTAVD